MNIAIQLGPKSHGLTDVDLDCIEAIALAEFLLPPTDAIFGRKSKPGSHRLYITDLSANQERAVIKYSEPVALARNPDKPATLVELRIGEVTRVRRRSFRPRRIPRVSGCDGR